MSRNKGRNSTQKAAKKAKLFGGRDTKPCCFCRRTLTKSTATLEHLIPLSKGGGWEMENLRLSCAECNRERGAQDFAAFRSRKRAWIASCTSHKQGA